MTQTITIHGGANEIGGNCIEVAAGGVRLLLDAGQPLSGRVVVLPDELKTVDAVIISHPHQDHFGLVDQIPDTIPIYMGATGTRLVQASRLFMGQPPLTNHFVPLVHRQSFQLGDLQITPYMVDHSAFDAYAILLDDGDARVFYTGDFRRHGRKKSLVDALVADPPRPIHTLIIEGTMLDRTNLDPANEPSAEEKMADLLRATPGAAFLVCSSQNLDRIVSAFRACIKAEREFVVDIYTAWILRVIAEDPRTTRTPDIRWEEVRVLSRGATASRHYRTVKANRNLFGRFTRELYAPGTAITHDEIAASPSRYLLKNPKPDWLIDTLKLRPCSVIYSMWQGYLEPKHNPTGWQKLTALRNDPEIDFQVIHTSGHAVLDDLRRLTNALKPSQVLPVHTEDPDRLRALLNPNSPKGAP